MLLLKTTSEFNIYNDKISETYERKYSNNDIYFIF